MVLILTQQGTYERALAVMKDNNSYYLVKNDNLSKFAGVIIRVRFYWCTIIPFEAAEITDNRGIFVLNPINLIHPAAIQQKARVLTQNCVVRKLLIGIYDNKTHHNTSWVSDKIKQC